MPKDVYTEGTPVPHDSLVIVPDDEFNEGAVHGSVTSKPSAIYNNVPKNVYTDRKKPVFTRISKSSSPNHHTGNSFLVLKKEIQPSKNSSYPQKRVRKKTKKAMESKAQENKDLLEESASQI